MTEVDVYMLALTELKHKALKNLIGLYDLAGLKYDYELGNLYKIPNKTTPRKFVKDGFKDKNKNEALRSVLDPKKINAYINKYYDRNETRIYYAPNPNKGMLIERKNFNNIWFYIDYLYYIDGIDKPTLLKIFKNNTYGITDELIRMFKEIIDAPFKHLAIQKIKRNAIYNNGLGLKLAIKAYNKDF
jgi:hypothetical protein